MESCSDDVIDWLQRGVWSALGMSAIMLSFQVITQVFDTEVKGQSIISTKGEKARGGGGGGGGGGGRGGKAKYTH